MADSKRISMRVHLWSAGCYVRERCAISQLRVEKINGVSAKLTGRDEIVRRAYKYVLIRAAYERKQAST